LRNATAVSVLFSEPKIPQSSTSPSRGAQRRSFSALQRAENSSIIAQSPTSLSCWRFQCSSASRKFLNHTERAMTVERRSFQCSSASRKFLNEPHQYFPVPLTVGFSALQRAENSSMQFLIRCVLDKLRGFSALQRAENSSIKH